MSLTYDTPQTSYRVFGISLAACQLVPLVGGWWYGDTLQLQGAFVIAVVAGLFGTIGPWLSPARAQAGLQLLNLAAIAGAKLTFADDTISGPIFLGFALSSTIFANRNAVAYAVVAGGAVLTFSVPYLGTGPSAVPMDVNAFFVLSVFAYFAFGYVSKARSLSQSATEALTAADERLRKDHRRLLDGQTALRHSQAELAALNAELASQLERERTTTKMLAAKRADEQELVRAIHHDLREPLRSIVSFSQITLRRIGSRPDCGRAGEYLAFAKDGGLRMTRLLDDLRAYTAPLDDQQAPRWVSLAEVCAEVRDNLQDLITRTGAELDIAPDLPEVRGHASQLVQLFQNLLSNALKFARPGVPPCLRVGAQPVDGQLSIEVRDNGIGIPSERLSQIFDLFQRVATETPVEGSGVGLALCRRIALGHGGQLVVRSTPGIGSTFCLTLPTYRPPTARQESQPLESVSSIRII